MKRLVKLVVVMTLCIVMIGCQKKRKECLYRNIYIKIFLC